MPWMTAKELRAWQQARNFTSVQMCKILAIAPCTYSRWINDRQPLPRWLPHVLARINIPETPAAATTRKETV